MTSPLSRGPHKLAGDRCLRASPAIPCRKPNLAR
jgi:hypothetical protein